MNVQVQRNNNNNYNNSDNNQNNSGKDFIQNQVKYFLLNLHIRNKHTQVP